MSLIVFLAKILLLILPILDVYTFPVFVNNASTAALFVILFLLFFSFSIRNVERNSTNNKQILFTGITIMCLFVAALFNSDISGISNSVRKMLSIVIMFLILIMANRWKKHAVSFINMYVKFSVAFSVYAILQTIFMYLFRIQLPAHFFGFETTKELFDAVTEYNRLGVFRAQSIFTEPASFAVYVIPALCLILLSKQENEHSLVKAFLISFGIICSTSSTGIILAVFIWGIYIFINFKQHFLKVLTIAFIGIIIIYVVSIKSDYIRSSLFAIFNISQVSGKSGDRIFRGFAVYRQLPILNQIFGIGFGNGEYFIKNYSIVTKYDSIWSTSYDYFNGLSSAFIYGGVVAGISNIFTFMVYLKSRKLCQKIVAGLIVVLSLGCSIFFNSIYIFLSILIIFIGVWEEETNICIEKTINN